MGMSFESVVNKKVLVTAGNRGLGLECVKLLAKQGANVILTARQKRQGEEIVGSLQKINPQGEYKFIQLDLNDDNSISEAAKEASKYKPIDVLVNNAGILSRSSNQASFDKVYRVNVLGTVKFTELMLPSVSDGGRVVMLSSEEGQTFMNNKDMIKQIKQIDSIESLAFKGQIKFLGGAPYGLSKAIINRYVKLASQDPQYTSRNISITSCHPGWCKTEMGGMMAPHSAAEGAESMLWSISTKKNINGQCFTFGSSMQID